MKRRSIGRRLHKRRASPIAQRAAENYALARQVLGDRQAGYQRESIDYGITDARRWRVVLELAWKLEQDYLSIF